MPKDRLWKLHCDTLAEDLQDTFTTLNKIEEKNPNALDNPRLKQSLKLFPDVCENTETELKELVDQKDKNKTEKP